MRRWVAVTATATMLVVATQSAALAHRERPTVELDGTGSVPTYRADDEALLVCGTDEPDFVTRIAAFPEELRASNEELWDECQDSGFHTWQEAVDAATDGTTIKVLPGVYVEEPSLAAPTAECAELAAGDLGPENYDVLSLEDQQRCPHVQNLVAIFGKQDLQIEGTGAEPEDVVLDAQFEKLNALRADRTDGIYLRNFTAQRATFNAVYILESDGFVIDQLVGRWNHEYGFLTFADDHGLYTDCEGYGNGDSGIYPGAAADINRDRGHDVLRYAIEIRDCYSHDNLLGYSGTAGDSVWAHDNRFVDNQVGVATDSAFPDHPGLPQNHALFEDNEIGDNTRDYYGYVRDGTCAKPFAERGYEDGVVCPAVGAAQGVGVLNPGGNYNIWRNNWVYGNPYAGFLTSAVPAFIRGETSLGLQFDTSHHNRYYDNRLGEAPDGSSSPNGIDFWWDGQGVGSCWQQPVAGSEPRALPRCDDEGFASGARVGRYVAEPDKLLTLFVCSAYSLEDAHLPAGCSWFGATGIERVEVQYAVAGTVVLGLLLLALWRRVVRRALVGVLLVVAGGVVSAFGAMNEASLLPALGLLVSGCGWLVFGLALVRLRRKLGLLTLAIAVFALAGAVDRSFFILPWLPLPPSWFKLLLEIVWVVAALVAIVEVGPRRGARTVAPA